jgi:hypothetical protein
VRAGWPRRRAGRLLTDADVGKREREACGMGRGEWGSSRLSGGFSVVDTGCFGRLEKKLIILAARRRAAAALGAPARDRAAWAAQLGQDKRCGKGGARAGLRKRASWAELVGGGDGLRARTHGLRLAAPGPQKRLAGGALGVGRPGEKSSWAGGRGRARGPRGSWPGGLGRGRG